MKQIVLLFSLLVLISLAQQPIPGLSVDAILSKTTLGRLIYAHSTLW